MKNIKSFIFLFIFFLLFSLNLSLGSGSKLIDLIPEIQGWNLTEKPQVFKSDNLYEYINGGAEIYLSYDFQELIVAEFQNQEGISVLIEIYDMGNEKNSFGIYSLERSPESKYLLLGNHGYIDGESLYFIVGTYYIKINCFECYSQAENYLTNFARAVLNRIKDKRKLPKVLEYFPKKGLIKNSEKFFLKNFMGLKFLSNGYQATYNLNGEEFSIFILENKNCEDANNVYQKLKDHFQKKGSIKSFLLNEREGIIAQNKYYKNITIILVNSYLCGTLKLENIDTAKKFLSEIISKIEGKR